MQFKHNLPIAIWCLATFMDAVVLAFVALFLKDGPFSEPLFNWAFALGLLVIAYMIGSHAFSKPCVRLTLEASGIRLRLRYPLTAQTLNYRLDQLQAARLVETKDSEGDPYFTFCITFADGRIIELAEGSRDVSEPVLTEFTTALRAVGAGIAPSTETAL